MSVEFENAWYDLNLRLRELESSAGLAAALHELETHHLNSGFIANSLHEIERRTFYHPHNSERYFRVQYNPRRALRFAGSDRNGTQMPVGEKGCFLCRDNIEWQQQGAQLGYRVETGERSYYALTNPFPILPSHIVIASTEHHTQDWRFRDENGLDIADLIDDLVRLADRMPGHLGFYNGVDGGASIPTHLHLQFVQRPDNATRFPLEVAARAVGGSAGTDGPSFVEHYPLDVAVWVGAPDDVVARASRWLTHWSDRNRVRLDKLSANIIASRDIGAEELALYFVARDRAKPRAEGFSGLAGGLEVLGELVMSSADEKDRLDDGSIGYFDIEAALASLRVSLDEG
ncbi:MAG: DUF4922 domain-containing protein [Alphaproteobacteria bacterium]|nr:DUF4922 domain-containing protein [Alphaproteobacteria bacterium]